MKEKKRRIKRYKTKLGLLSFIDSNPNYFGIHLMKIE